MAETNVKLTPYVLEMKPRYVQGLKLTKEKYDELIKEFLTEFEDLDTKKGDSLQFQEITYGTYAFEMKGFEPEDFTITAGLIDRGSFGKKRRVRKASGKTKTNKVIDKDEVVADDFYVYFIPYADDKLILIPSNHKTYGIAKKTLNKFEKFFKNKMIKHMAYLYENAENQEAKDAISEEYKGSVIPFSYDRIQSDEILDKIEQISNVKVIKTFKNSTTERISGIIGDCDIEHECRSIEEASFKVQDATKITNLMENLEELSKEDSVYKIVIKTRLRNNEKTVEYDKGEFKALLDLVFPFSDENIDIKNVMFALQKNAQFGNSFTNLFIEREKSKK
ncbi:hypothetical protein [Methanococcus maripaludis]|uniref:Uncharacterized protein n=1 Tax=Methanococcus maripaludis (strain DSM 14266 / JCM 13030 / NBRC 101832 / S2 / LL) TaxID=267377 RepID=Q6LZ64_METMP|nr:hypothetical protein [Methanococcus maripaludis]CAF30321.1 hypothetical [Methanococcus maripaludis S2]